MLDRNTATLCPPGLTQLDIAKIDNPTVGATEPFDSAYCNKRREPKFDPGFTLRGARASARAPIRQEIS
jgi:hypothetical protein